MPFSNNGPLMDVYHTAGTTTFTVKTAGTYLVSYDLSITYGADSQLAVAVNGVVDASTPITALVSKGELSGSAVLTLAKGDVITLRNNSATPFDMTEAPGVGAQMTITKLSANYGYGYELATETDETVPGGVDVPFSNYGPSNEVTHLNTTEFKVATAGTYLISYDVNIAAGFDSAIAIAVNGTVDASTPITALIATGGVSGSAVLTLAAGDVITLRNNSSVELKLANSPGVGAQMSIVKVDASYGYELATYLNCTVVGGTDVPFSNNGPLNGVLHDPGTTTFTVTETGTYLINYDVNITDGIGSAITIAVNGTVDASTPIPALVNTGKLSGSAVLTLAAGDVITLHNNSATPFVMTLNPGVGAQVNIIKVG